MMHMIRFSQFCRQRVFLLEKRFLLKGEWMYASVTSILLCWSPTKAHLAAYVNCTPCFETLLRSCSCVIEGIQNSANICRYSAEPEAQLNPKKKIFEKISPDLKTSADGIALYKDVPFQTSRGPVKSTLVNAFVK